MFQLPFIYQLFKGSYAKYKKYFSFTVAASVCLEHDNECGTSLLTKMLSENTLFTKQTICSESQTHLASGSCGSILGSSAWGSEKSRARLVSFFWKNLRESLFFFMGLPCAAAARSPCRTDIFPQGAGFVVCYWSATAHPTGENKKCSINLAGGRHQSSTWPNVTAHSSLRGSLVTIRTNKPKWFGT